MLRSCSPGSGPCDPFCIREDFNDQAVDILQGSKRAARRLNRFTHPRHLVSQKETCMTTPLTQRLRSALRIPYVLRHVPASKFETLLPCPTPPRAGDIALARLEKMGKNRRLELATGRAASLHEGDTLAVVFGNRYATEQFEGYAQADGDACDLLSMG